MEIEENTERKLLIRNVPEYWDSWNCFTAFQPFGVIYDIHLSRHPQAGGKIGLIEMVNASDIDKIFRTTNNGHLKVDDTILKVESVRKGLGASGDIKENVYSSRGSYHQHQTRAPRFMNDEQPSKFCHIPHGDLAISKEVVVELVDKPSNFVEKNGEMTIFFRQKECNDTRYSEMQRELDRYVASRPPDGRQARLGDDVIVAYNRTAYRARVTELGDTIIVYLLDFGKTVAAEEIWLVRFLHFQSTLKFRLPQLVLQCQLANTSYENEKSINKIRNMLHTLASYDKVEFQVKLEGFRGIVNLVHLNILQAATHETLDFARSVSNQGLCNYNKEKEINEYSNQELHKLNRVSSIESVPLCLLAQKDLLKEDVKIQMA